ncbi:hypothetical protein Gogos_019141 [Gossypium gossypioides]|uniref:Uncharacterized protein n=1 Tax=Gossypium gossypioides TaxID=34282 RepID=A0A7J9BGK4_GOSGO|nr:hypothetical protein [Gossypium gossypioides]
MELSWGVAILDLEEKCHLFKFSYEVDLDRATPQASIWLKEESNQIIPKNEEMGRHMIYGEKLTVTIAGGSDSMRVDTERNLIDLGDEKKRMRMGYQVPHVFYSGDSFRTVKEHASIQNVILTEFVRQGRHS